MIKIIAIILAFTLALSMLVYFNSSRKHNTETSTTVITEAEEETEETTKDANLPKAGDTLTFGSAKITIPKGWVVDEYEESKKLELNPENDSFPIISIDLHDVYNNERAKEWADNINENYGGNCKIDKVKIGGKDFYRVEGDPEQHVCFADLDDSTYLEVAVMFMPWDDAKAVLDAITIG